MVLCDVWFMEDVVSKVIDVFLPRMTHDPRSNDIGGTVLRRLFCM